MMRRSAAVGVRPLLPRDFIALRGLADVLSAVLLCAQ